MIQTIPMTAATGKPWYQALTIWSSIIAMAMTALGMFKTQEDPNLANDAATWLGQIATALAAGFAIYGRIRATRTIATPAATTRASAWLIWMALLTVTCAGCTHSTATTQPLTRQQQVQVAVDNASDVFTATVKVLTTAHNDGLIADHVWIADILPAIHTVQDGFTLADQYCAQGGVDVTLALSAVEKGMDSLRRFQQAAEAAKNTPAKPK